MDRQEAIKTLLAAGKADEVKQLIVRRANSATNAYKQIRQDTTRTADA